MQMPHNIYLDVSIQFASFEWTLDEQLHGCQRHPHCVIWGFHSKEQKDCGPLICVAM
jgi:hypothetical protein